MSGHLHLRLSLQRADFALEIDLTLPAHGITVLFGPSGCGKTTTLRCVAGLERAKGRVAVGSDVWQDDDTGRFLPTWQRNLGYVFQEASLLAHLTVEQNLLYGLKRSGRRVDMQGVQTCAHFLGITHLFKRMPETLSGGERQRVAIARSLALQPSLLLLDEPLASLDADRRRDILPWLERLRDDLKIPALYVTHSVDELMRLADHVVFMNDGKVTHQGPLRTALQHPDISSRLGEEAGVVIEGGLQNFDSSYQLSCVDIGDAQLWVKAAPEHASDTPLGVGAESAHASNAVVKRNLRLRILARDVSLSLDEHSRSSIQNRIAGVVSDICNDTHPSQLMVSVQCGQHVILSRITRRSADQMSLSKGQPVWCQIKSAAFIN